jgi:hypothetical protein
MADKITETAILECDKGSIPTPLSVTSQNFCYLANKLIATENDNQPIVNIKPFGVCRLKPSAVGYLPCVPSPTAWQKTSDKDEISGKKILTENSTCPCSTGGTIKIQDKGHSENHSQD